MPDVLFVHESDNVLVPTELTRGVWDSAFQHGGPVCGLLGWVVQRDAPDGFELARLTVEMLSAVPVAPLRVVGRVVKPGRRTHTIDGEIWAGDRLVARATSQWLMPNGQGSAMAADGPVPPIPDEVADPGSGDIDYPRPGFNCDAVELRFVSGSTETEGASMVWIRLRQPVVDAAESAAVRIAALSDMAAAAGWTPAPDGSPMINPDVTLHLARQPEGDWICFDASQDISSDGLGLCEAVLSDHRGPFGRVLQSLLANPGASFLITPATDAGVDGDT